MEKAEDSLEIITRYFPDCTPGQLRQFGRLGGLYREWNEKINVISRKDIDQLYEKHVLHSLSIAAVFKFVNNTSIIDIGTGGGFPGIPLSIYFPGVRFHLVDSVGKKIKVVNEIRDALQLKNVTTAHCRVEEINAKFDFAISRAVTSLKYLYQWSRPLLHTHKKKKNTEGGLICLKGGDLSTEIKESRQHPQLWKISDIFPELGFDEKYVLYIPV